MAVNRKWDGFTVEDFKEVAKRASMKRGRAEAILGEVTDGVWRRPEFAAAAGVTDTHREDVGGTLRLTLQKA